MKLYLLCFITIFIFIDCNTNKSEKNRDIKNIKEEWFNFSPAQGGEENKIQTRNAETFYNKNKKEDSIILFNSDKSINSIIHFVYSTRGNKISEVLNNPKLNLISTVAYKYDSNNNLLEEGNDYGNGIEVFQAYKYNDKNQNVEIESFHNGKSTGISKNEFDAKGRIIKSTEYNNKSKMEGWEDYIYDNIGNKIESIYYRVGEKSFAHKNLYKYDNYKNIIEQQSIYPNKTIVLVFKYEYDKYHNWIRQDIYENGRHSVSMTKEISYF